jgi:hypothetical protein
LGKPVQFEKVHRFLSHAFRSPRWMSVHARGPYRRAVSLNKWLSSRQVAYNTGRWGTQPRAFMHSQEERRRGMPTIYFAPSLGGAKMPSSTKVGISTESHGPSPRASACAIPK